MNSDHDIAAVSQAKARYCRYLDTKQWDAFADLLHPTPEISFYDPAGNLVVGFDERQAFVDATRHYLHAARSIHQVHNGEFNRVSADEMAVIWSMEDLIVFPDASPSRHHGYGHYFETWVRTASSWSIVRLELRRTILETTP